VLNEHPSLVILEKARQASDGLDIKNEHQIRPLIEVIQREWDIPEVRYAYESEHHYMEEDALNEWDRYFLANMKIVFASDYVLTNDDMIKVR
jgi:hypothetical protein